MPIKIGFLALFVLIALNSAFEFSHTLLLNTRTDALNHLYESSNIPKDVAYSNAIGQLRDEIVCYRNMFETTADAFTVKDDIEHRTPLLNTLSSAIVPIIVFIVLLFHLMKEMIIKRDDQIERLVNILSLMIFVFLLFYGLIAFSYAIPTFPEGFVWGNYCVNILITLVLYLLICGIVTSLSDWIIAAPVDLQADVPAVEELDNTQPDPQQDEE